ncbi:MAG TPA: alpha-amylase family glycosyl hydrolase [Verrucomicrobiae bacterium]|nr:alpha-amylase family glycosyl hydrolase [Verrucomicrobiae bacterium]
MKFHAALLFVGAVLSGTAFAQSSRPGWGSTPYHDASGTGVTFRVWAPNATSVYVPGEFNGWSTTANPLGKEVTNGIWSGVWSGNISTASTGQQYKYFINYSGGSVWKHDPRARLVTFSGTTSGANDIIYDPAAFNWKGDNLNPPALNDLFVYELHIGTFYTNGAGSKFVSATNRLDYLKSLGVNAVEVLPIAEFPGDAGWGYNPAQPFAVENIGYGGADGFKTFVQACHLRGIAVLLDVVHNHYGPTDLDMWDFDGYTGSGPIGGGIYFWESNTNLEITPYGDTRPNFSSNEVCNFIQDNFTMWLSEYHVDGFRWDTPGLMMNANNNGYITNAGNLINAINSMIHTNYTGKISIAEDVYNSFGFDSAWDTTYPYSFTPVLTNTVDANRDMTAVANAVQYNVRYGGAAGSGRVAFLEDHDVVGDLNNGVRLVTAIDPNTPNSYRARKLSTLGAAVTIAAPGVPMIFQGQEMLENQSFDSSRSVDWTKTNTYSYIVRFYSDLIKARRDLKGYTPGLEGNQCGIIQTDNVKKLIAFHRWKSAATKQDAVVIANFSGVTLSNYGLNFPYGGNWHTHLNSDSTNYGSDYGNIGSFVVTASGPQNQANVTIGPYSLLIMSQTPDSPPQLSVAASNGVVSVSWPSSYFEWILYSRASLTTNSAWAQVSPAQYQTNSSTVSVSITPSSGYSFYRLQKM